MLANQTNNKGPTDILTTQEDIKKDTDRCTKLALIRADSIFPNTTNST